MYDTAALFANVVTIASGGFAVYRLIRFLRRRNVRSE